MLRGLLVTAVAAVIALFVAVYLLLLIPAVQGRIKAEGEKAASDFLKTRVSIGRVSIRPFNQLLLYDVRIPGQKGDSLISVDKLAAGISLYNLALKSKIVITYGEIIGLKGNITRATPQSPTNAQFLIDAFKPKPGKPPRPYDVTIHNVVIRRSELSYDVLSEPRRRGRFDKNHITVYNLKADVQLPRIKNNDYSVVVRRLSFAEASGFMLKNFAVSASVTDRAAKLSGIQIELPGTLLVPEDIGIEYSSLKNLGKEIKDKDFSLTLANSYVTLSDLQCFVPAFAKFQDPIEITASLSGGPRRLSIPVLMVRTRNNRIAVEARGELRNLANARQLMFNLPHIRVSADAGEVAKLTQNLVQLSPQVLDKVLKCGDIRVDGSLSGQPSALKYAGTVGTSLGRVVLDGAYASAGRDKHFSGHVATGGFNLGRLLGKEGLLGSLALNAQLTATLGRTAKSGSVNGRVDYIDFKGYRYKNITANFTAGNRTAGGRLAVNDPNFMLNLDGEAVYAGARKSINASIKARNVNLAHMHLLNGSKYADKSVTLDGNVSLSGRTVDDMLGHIALSDVAFVNRAGAGLHIGQLLLTSGRQGSEKVMELKSDFVNGTVTGNYRLSSLVGSVRYILDRAMPGMQAGRRFYAKPHGQHNSLRCQFTLQPSDELEALVKLPVKLVYPATLSGELNDDNETLQLNCSIPYLLQGKKLIDGTTLSATVSDKRVGLSAQSNVPTKDGKAELSILSGGSGGTLDTNVGWRIRRKRDYHGDVNFTTRFSRSDDRRLACGIDVNPTKIIVNDTVWQLSSGHVDVKGGTVSVQDLFGFCDKQFIKVGGTVSKNPDDVLTVALNDINLDYIFETLNIDNVKFGGRATGTFYASDLMSGAPRLSTPNLHVNGLKYNDALMGNADITSSWDNTKKAVNLNADLAQANGDHSRIGGAIFVADDSLHLTFDAQRANVSFMKPFMAAFASDVQGYASGHAVLYGNFHTIDLYGDLYVQDLKFKIGYTNVYYTCTDSVHIKPGNIAFSGITIKDRDQHTAKLSGWLRHEAFHNPTFNFSITDARDFLCYDVGPGTDLHWNGTVYGNGAAFVSGEPGLVKINVNMQTAPRSRFTFELSDAEEASQYSFITFRDRDAVSGKKPKPATPADSIPESVRLLVERNKAKDVSAPTIYSINLQGDITPDAQLVLLMDPVGGDKIKATGSGNLRLAYNNADDKFEMYGKYTLDRGNYNFTLQDIIIKDFTIRSGSSISFNGDPYSAMLDIDAIYSLNANILDIDQSFADDKELNRTSVPVYAVLRAKGVVSQPDIAFDLEFPTLTSDAVRKIKSVISTDDMMNRQIIYLLALNRFYTPDYMANNKSNNELTSVASSTISSQLSNILGQISDKWTVAPNFRSNKGDFSDMEVDLALSSQLLNNRLLFNGNFGYRDNTFNTRNSNFIGDFDIEYLINKRGTIRLKAYNHFNDQNYYVRNAMTTQGVGIVFKHDFDRLINFRAKRAAKPDSVRRSTVARPHKSDTVHTKQ